MKGSKIIAILLFTIIAVGLVGCVSSSDVTFNTDVDGAEVYIDGELIGTTPTTIELSNAVWEDPDIVIRKTGYKDLKTNLRKEIKGPNVVFGLLLNTWAWLWVYGPKENQSFILTPTN